MFLDCNDICSSNKIVLNIYKQIHLMVFYDKIILKDYFTL
ncbi:hypothetical protein DES36_11861 [Alkalibaculum bacchi]|uniref:Uncharacterized protein n=1 Tax=Alkalibaculum bacchi TaxID=645887 RepID=A0A366HZE9_9FIRM|nr:hypothetical protein DES36_11861 [Alkalibaculum bacchi]